MASDGLPWEGVYWPLVGVALNTMIQPCGRVCGSDPNLHVYARSSPVVCAFDSVAILFRFLLHLTQSRSPFVAAKWTLEDRNADEDADPQESFRAPLLLKLIIFVVGPVYCFGKLVMAHNIGWTQVWAWCYIVSYFAIWTLRVLKIFAKEEETLRRPQWQRYPRKAVDEGLGYVALVLQILIFAWVDLAAISPDTDLLLRYTYQFFRLGGLGVAIGIHYMFAKVHLRGVNPAPDAMKALSVLFILIILGLMLLLHILGRKYTQMYLFFSIISAVGSWLLFWSPHCKELVVVAGDGNWQTVVAFDFFCRAFTLSLFWYSTCYDPTGTWLSTWAEIFG